MPDFTALTRIPLRWILPWGVIMALVATALIAWEPIIARVHLLSLVEGIRVNARHEVSVFRALNGRMPSDTDLAFLRESSASVSGETRRPILPGTDALTFANGSFRLNLGALSQSGRGPEFTGHLGWFQAEGTGDATTIWMCGYAQAPPGARPLQMPELTDISPELLPSICRETL